MTQWVPATRVPYKRVWECLSHSEKHHCRCMHVRCAYLLTLLCRFDGLPRWHMQGLRPDGRRLFIETALTDLRRLLERMPVTTHTLSNAIACKVVSVAVVLLALRCCSCCLRYTPTSLLHELHRRLKTAMDDLAEGGMHLLEQSHPATLRTLIHMSSCVHLYILTH